MLSIAVIIANRNNASYLPECLDSVLRQRLAPEEVIVVDDASTDQSLAVLEPYLRRGQIQLLRNESILGVAASRHRAIVQSRAEFLTTLDADDFYYSEEKLAAEARVLQGAPDVARIAFSDVMRVDVSGREIGLVSRKRKIREGCLSRPIRFLRGFIPRDYLVARSRYFSAGGYDDSFRTYEDWELKIRLSRDSSWHYSGVIGTAYRNNPRGLSRSPRREHIETMRRIYARHCPARDWLSRSLAFCWFFVCHSLYMRRPAF